jgi:acetyl esterase/lipase
MVLQQAFLTPLTFLHPLPPVSQPARLRASPRLLELQSLLEPPGSWDAWSLRDVGVFDAGFLIVGAASLFVLSAGDRQRDIDSPSVPTAELEERVPRSAEYSPCNGPDMEAIEALEAADKAVTQPPSTDPNELQPLAALRNLRRRGAPPRMVATETAARTSQCGGRALAAQDFPPFLDSYHERSLELTEAALADEAVTCARGVSYGPESHQTLDVWSPAAGGDKLPIVVGIHGGGWEYGYPEWTGFPAQHICAAPALFITPAYTLGDGHRLAWPASRDDLLLALQWVREHAASLGGDPSRLVLTGHSAGGHLASCLGLNPSLLTAAGIDPLAIKALFLVSCPVGLRAEDFAPARWLWRFRVGRPLVRALYRKVAPNLRAVIGDPADAATAAEASALVSVLAAEPESLPPLVHLMYGGKGDFPFCRPQAAQLQRLLTQSQGGPRVEVLELAGAGHFQTHYELADEGSAWHAALRDVLNGSLALP